MQRPAGQSAVTEGLGDMIASHQGAVDAGAADAHPDSEIHGGPSGPSGGAVRADLVLRPLQLGHEPRLQLALHLVCVDTTATH
eukprot:scaffold1638_cov258-Pinguiococcus_pyrenoidosus.AAC.100